MIVFGGSPQGETPHIGTDCESNIFCERSAGNSVQFVYISAIFVHFIIIVLYKMYCLL